MQNELASVTRPHLPSHTIESLLLPQNLKEIGHGFTLLFSFCGVGFRFQHPSHLTWNQSSWPPFLGIYQHLSSHNPHSNSLSLQSAASFSSQCVGRWRREHFNYSPESTVYYLCPVSISSKPVLLKLTRRLFPLSHHFPITVITYHHLVTEWRTGVGFRGIRWVSLRMWANTKVAIYNQSGTTLKSLHTLTHQITTTQWSRYYYFQFTDEEMDVR